MRKMTQLKVTEDKIEYSAKDLPLLIALQSATSSKRVMRLLELFGSFEEIAKAPAGELASALSVSINIGREIRDALKQTDKFKGVIEQTTKAGARIVCYWDEEYPNKLKMIPNFPLILYVKGVASSLYNYAVAIVGTRVPSDYSHKLTLQIARDLSAAGVTVVSGMAAGIDSFAHEGALAAGGRTVAVLGSGIDVVYPPSNKKLYEKICNQGLVVSEYAPKTRPDTFHFPQRNRIISGMSLGVLIVEAGNKSGALITARTAMDQGRELLAIPGPAGSPRNAGTNRLIKDGAAIMVENAAEIIEHLKPKLAQVLNVAAATVVPQLHINEAKIYNLLEDGPLLQDDLVKRTGFSAIEVSRLLTSMQLKGLLVRMPGSRIARMC